ncbi:ras-related and estrogen-regulated growth inhibitor-like isoform X3 [Mercenaria mercenaria]|uniref:ras-related and estrogen-regulated growth inhibitor-like isoform X1 n=1 Tax=Mercenaria mercenaria TaxID=6596 RepID=UPI001E1E153F|nr:ras-related and estrogen-regulated growth inhibitor-like isoform X1 [Mercenaria mercenaria]XP_045176283.1 ras-related and estrogen-regulated growth inhibitor-like isoform X2 [Mercenaria mercenaria]XP_045176284.1 ras-related and estrogen-regulated growth inhibitor-like isoform X3 [Mercenaria mercenaria]
MKGTVHIVVLGKENVGKTAVAVRYLTGRYLTEYAHAPEMTYERNVNVDGKHVPLKITDISRKQIEQRSGNKEFLNKVDGIVVVYAINDRHSFEFAEGICDWIRREKKPSTQVPVVLLGNKADLTHDRCVSCQKTEELKWRHDGYLVTECSASTEVVEVNKVFNTLINKILEKRESSSKSPRRLSQNPLGSPKIIRASLKRRFSVFTRERTSTM